ncbi:SdiA-regulated domain-containing protein [Salinimicrobium gaetbulicola]|uniref:SdiA-regulated domain-containing protein n=1 Tax=Salinimicrobium gaetbulicola TaxID=999702 RepID=A0ABW3ICZ9_9FLAO
MGVNKATILITTGLVAISLVIILAFERKFGSLDVENANSDVKIEKTWELPDELEEISGFAFVSAVKVACIQDEDGTIFIFNLQTSEIEKEIDFSDSGDYEGITVKGNTAYVLESNGDIYQVQDFMNGPEVTKFETRLSSNNDVEGICLDKSGTRLLMAIKEKDPVAKGYKGIYAFDLNLGKIQKDPAYKITFEDKVFKDKSKKEIQDVFKPSEIAIHPSSGEIYLTEGEDPQLLILEPTGKVKALYNLNKSDFPQPEGIAFDPSGNLYISNEGNPGTIHKVTLK